MATINFGSTISVPDSLVQVAQTTGNDILDVGYQCRGTHPFFEFTASGKTNVYTKIHPTHASQATSVSVYQDNAAHSEDEMMTYIGTGTQTNGTLSYNGTTYTCNGNASVDRTLKNIKIWNLYKPVPYNSFTDNGSWAGTSTRCTIGGLIGSAYGVKCVCKNGTGTSQFGLKLASCEYRFNAPTTHFRLRDFDGYCTDVNDPSPEVYSVTIGKGNGNDNNIYTHISLLPTTFPGPRVSLSDYFNSALPSWENVSNFYMAVALVKDSDNTTKVRALQCSWDVIDNPNAAPMKWGTWDSQPKSWGTILPSGLTGSYKLYFFLTKSLDPSSTQNITNWLNINSTSDNFPSPLNYFIPIPGAWGEPYTFVENTGQSFSVTGLQYKFADGKIWLKITFSGTQRNAKYSVRLAGPGVDYYIDNIQLSQTGSYEYEMGAISPSSSTYLQVFVNWKDTGIGGGSYSQIYTSSAKQITSSPTSWTNW